MKAYVTSNGSMHRIEADGGHSPVATRGLSVGLAVIQLVLAYECLVSGINKILNANFTVQLAGTLQQNISHNPYGWYVFFLRGMVLPHASLFGLMTELGELSIGVSLLFSGLLWLVRPDSRLTRHAARVACLALAGAVFLPLNFFFMNGTSLPWINPANAFNEGVTIDILMPCLAVTLLVANMQAMKTTTVRLIERSPEYQRTHDFDWLFLASYRALRHRHPFRDPELCPPQPGRLRQRVLLGSHKEHVGELAQLFLQCV